MMARLMIHKLVIAGDHTLRLSERLTKEEAKRTDRNYANETMTEMMHDDWTQFDGKWKQVSGESMMLEVEQVD